MGSKKERVRSTWSKCRIEDINVDADVHVGGPDSVLDRGDYLVDSALVDFPGGDGGEAAFFVVFHIPFFAD